jgi:hypothetical protein
MANDSVKRQGSARGKTQRRTTGSDAPLPRIPAERDESADTQDAGAPAADSDPLRADMRQANADLAQGQVDTDERRRAANGLMDRLNRKNTRSGKE